MPINPTRFASIFLFIVAVLSTSLRGQSTLISLTTRRDMLFDHAGKYLYITTSDGYVRPYNLSTNQLEAGYYLGGSLNGLDIAPDDSFLLIAQKNLQASQVIVHRLDLMSGVATNIGFTPHYFEIATGAWDVAIGPTGFALVTSCDGGGGGTAFIRQIDLASNVISQRNDAPGNGVANGGDGEIDNNTNIHRSADGSLFYFIGRGDSSGSVFTYNANTNAFSNTVQTNTFTYNAGAAVNRNGSLIATRLTGNGAALDSAPDFSFVHSFHEPDGGVAFDPQADTLYAVISSVNQIVAYDTSTFAEKFRFNIGETIPAGVTQFGSGTLVASADGRYLALETASGIRVYDISAVMAVSAPTPTFSNPRNLVFDHAGQHLYITTKDGFVWPYNLSSGTFDTPYNVGGSLNGVDVSPDDSFLLIAQGYSGIAQGAFQKLDLGTGSVTNINYTHLMLNPWAWSGEWGAWNVAITSNGLAFGTTDALTLGDVSLVRQLDYLRHVAVARTDVPGSGGRSVTEQTEVHRSSDGTRLYFLETRIGPNAPTFTYTAGTDAFSSAVMGDNFLSSSAVNRNGTLLGTRRRNTSFARLDTAPNISLVYSFNYLDSGVAFDGVQDTFYGVNSSQDQIVAYDTNTFAEKFRFDIGEDIPTGATPMGTGSLVASSDGRYLALITPSTVRVYGVPAVRLVSVVSEKIHGSAGVFDLNLPLDGPRAIECRSGGINNEYKIIFTFGLPLNSVGGVTVSKGTATVASSQIDSSDSHRYIVNLTGVVNAQYLRVTLSDVIDSAGAHTNSISQQFGLLIGDTNGDRFADSVDVSQTKSQSGHAVTSANFREDINDDGFIDSVDTALVKGKSGSALGPPPSTSSPILTSPNVRKTATPRRSWHRSVTQQH